MVTLLDETEFEKFYTIEEVIKYMKCSRTYLYKMMAEGACTGLKIGRRWLFTKDDIKSFIKMQREKSSSKSLIASPNIPVERVSSVSTESNNGGAYDEEDTEDEVARDNGTTVDDADDRAWMDIQDVCQMVAEHYPDYAINPATMTKIGEQDYIKVKRTVYGNKIIMKFNRESAIEFIDKVLPEWIRNTNKG